MRLCSPAGHPFLTTLAIAVLGLILSAVPSHAAEKAIWGPATLRDGRSAFGFYDLLQIDTLQLSLSWANIASVRPADPTDPADPAYRWPSEVTAAAAQAPAHGMRLALLVANAPRWANGNRAATYAPDDPQDYADFLTAAARRYPAVRRWMIWGEPNRDDRFQPNKVDDPAGPRAYALLLDAAYAVLKAQSPNNKVIGGNTWTSGTVKPPDFLRFMRLPSGRTPRLDWFGHNPFPFRKPNLADRPLPGGFRDISDTDTLSGEVGRVYRRKVPLWLSEYTIQSDHGSDAFATFVSRAEQAQYLSGGYRIADALGPTVAGLGWVALLDEPPATDSANWGLLTYALEPKPAFEAMVMAPSERLRPTVRSQRAVSRVTLRRRGLAVRVVARDTGPLTVQLRKGARLAARVQSRGVAERERTIRVRATAGRGRYTLTVHASGGSTVHRSVTIR